MTRTLAIGSTVAALIVAAVIGAVAQTMAPMPRAPLHPIHVIVNAAALAGLPRRTITGKRGAREGFRKV